MPSLSPYPSLPPSLPPSLQAEDPDLPAFYFDPLITPISAHFSEGDKSAEEEVREGGREGGREG